MAGCAGPRVVEPDVDGAPFPGPVGAGPQRGHRTATRVPADHDGLHRQLVEGKFKGGLKCGSTIRLPGLLRHTIPPIPGAKCGPTESDSGFKSNPGKMALAQARPGENNPEIPPMWHSRSIPMTPYCAGVWRSRFLRRGCSEVSVHRIRVHAPSEDITVAGSRDAGVRSMERLASGGPR